MTKNLYKTPKNWLTLDVCKNIFEEFVNTISLEEPIPPFDTRYPGKLEGILGSVSATFDDEYLNTTVLDAAAAYFNQFIRGHAFENGNKRLAVLFTHIFLLIHEVDYTLSDKEMYNFAIEIARAGEENIKAEDSKGICKAIIEKFTMDSKFQL